MLNKKRNIFVKISLLFFSPCHILHKCFYDHADRKRREENDVYDCYHFPRSQDKIEDFAPVFFSTHF